MDLFIRIIVVLCTINVRYDVRVTVQLLYYQNNDLMNFVINNIILLPVILAPSRGKPKNGVFGYSRATMEYTQ